MTEQHWLDNLFLDEKNPAPSAKISEKDRIRYDHLSIASRFGKEHVSDFEIRTMDAMFELALDDLLEEEKATHSTTWPKKHLALAATALLSIAAVAVFMLNSEDEFQSRGTSLGKADSTGPQVQVYCATWIDAHVEFNGDPKPTCKSDDELLVAYKVEDPTYMWGYFFGVSDQGKLLWYGPSPAEKEPVAIRLDKNPLPIGESIRLEVNHAPGNVKVVGVFSRHKQDFSEFRTWAEQAGPLIYHGEAAAIEQGVISVAEFNIVESE